MTRSKFFLGGTAFILAIAGALATKAKAPLQTTIGYTCTGDVSGGACHNSFQRNDVTVVASNSKNQHKFVSPLNGKTLRTCVAIPGHCGQTIYTQVLTD